MSQAGSAMTMSMSSDHQCLCDISLSRETLSPSNSTSDVEMGSHDRQSTHTPSDLSAFEDNGIEQIVAFKWQWFLSNNPMFFVQPFF